MASYGSSIWFYMFIFLIIFFYDLSYVFFCFMAYRLCRHLDMAVSGQLSNHPTAHLLFQRLSSGIRLGASSLSRIRNKTSPFPRFPQGFCGMFRLFHGGKTPQVSHVLMLNLRKKQKKKTVKLRWLPRFVSPLPDDSETNQITNSPLFSYFSWRGVGVA